MPGEPRGFAQDKRFPPDDPREWLNRARSNLAKATSAFEAPQIYLEDLCFDAQQAAEKAIKAVLIHLDVRFPYVHDLAQLLALVEQTGQSVPESIRRAASLSDYAVETRYPGLAEPVIGQEYDEAVAIAEEVVRWAQGIIERGTAERLA
ncbi:MAG: HEPN domain-containing protein [Chloroflexota bacterium]|nr:HEPN domain-containing protein [Chloroflexota bacterium]